MPRKENKKSISIRNIIIIAFVVLTITTVTSISSLVFSNWRSSASNTVSKIANDTNTEIYNQIEAFIHTPVHINEINQKLIENWILDLNNEMEREKFFVGVLLSHSNEIYSFSYGTENGEYYGARRNEKGVIEIMKNNRDTGGNSWYYAVEDDLTAGNLVLQAGKYDPRTRDWYKVAKEKGKPIFSPIYKHFVMPDLAVSAAWPIYNSDGELQGVLGTHLILSNIDGLLKDITDDKNGHALIVEKESGELIANSFDIENYQVLEDGKILRTQILDIENKALVEAYNRYITTNENSFKQKAIKDQFYMDFTEYTQNGIDWIIITAVPENLLISNIIDSMQTTYILIIILVLLSIAIYFIITQKLIKPVYSLIATAEKISEGDLSQRVPVVRNDELGRISYSFNKMADTILALIINLETIVKDRTTKLQTTNENLKESKDHLRLILDSTAEGIYGIDREGRCTFCNVSSLEILGYKNQEDLLGKNMHLQIHHKHRDGSNMEKKECEIFKALLTEKKAHVNDEVFWRANGTSFDVEYYSYPQYKDGEFVGAVVTFMDITERRKDEEKIKYLSCHDSLTGLINRRCFEEALKAHDTIEMLPLSVIFADVNGLKLTNDIFGHAAGDILIKKSAEVLKEACREGDIVARVGGDEFMLLLPNTEANAAQKVIEVVKSGLSKEKVNAIMCSMALGCDTKIERHQDVERIMENAENEMYKEKTLNRKAVGSEMINTIIETMHERYPDENRHSIVVSELCEKMGKAMSLPETEVKKLKQAGFLHDVGKIVLDDDVIYKESEQHSVIGYRILNLFDDTLDLAEGVFSHHEKWDGTGYPRGLKGEEIPMLSRIIALAENYDKKIYDTDINETESKTEAINYIHENAGKRFDPVLTEIFIKMLLTDENK